MAATTQPKPSVPNQHTINITDLRTETREIVEKAHFRGWHYVVLRAGQPMIAVLDYEEYARLVAIADNLLSDDCTAARRTRKGL